MHQSHRGVNELVASEREQHSSVSIQRRQRAGEAADRGAEIYQRGQAYADAAGDVGERRATGTKLGGVVFKTLHDQIGRQHEEHAGGDRGGDDGPGYVDGWIAGFPAQRRRALEADIGEDGEYDGLRGALEVNALEMSLLGIDLEAEMGKRVDAHEQDDGDRYHLKRQPDA